MTRGEAWIRLAVAGLMVLALAACQQVVLETEPEDAATVEAAEKSGELVESLTAANADGDFTEVEAILARDDPDGELRAALEEAGLLAVPGQERLLTGAQGVPDLPPFTAAAYRHGDVLVSKGSGTLTSTLMDLALVRGYGHAGILDKELSEELALVVEDVAAVLSADVDYLTEGGYAITLQTYDDWVADNDIVTVLRLPDSAYPVGEPGSPSPLSVAIAAIAAKAPGTEYAFLGYPGASVGSFEPIPKSDEHYWYCSKVPYAVYLQDGVAVDIEQGDFYTGELWPAFRESLLYKIYAFYTRLCHPFWSSRRVRNAADGLVKEVLAELVTPDELRADDDLLRAFTVTTDGIHYGDTFTDAVEVGWDSDVY